MTYGGTILPVTSDSPDLQYEKTEDHLHVNDMQGYMRMKIYNASVVPHCENTLESILLLSLTLSGLFSSVSFIAYVLCKIF